MAKTLGQVMRSLAKGLDTKLTTADEANQKYEMVVPYGDGRSQAILVTLVQDGNENSWLFVTSKFGEIADLDATELLRRNTTHYGHGFIGTYESGTASVMAQLLLEKVDEELLQAIVIDVAAFSDSLEEEFYGTDDN